MAAFTRKMLRDLGVEEEQIGAIMDAHVEVVNGLKDERDALKADAEKLEEVQKKMDSLQEAKKNGEDYKKKYEDLVAQNTAKEALTAKTAAYRKIVQGSGIAEKYIDTVIRASAADIEKMEMDGENVKDADKLTESLKSTWVDFIPVKETKGTKVETPPANGGSKMTKEEIMAIKDREERRAKIAENMDLFQ